MTTFRVYLQQKNISPSIIDRYAVIVERFEAFSITDLSARTKKDVLDYLHYLQEQKQLQNRSRQQILGVLKHYYTYLQSCDELTTNPTSFLHIRGAKKKLLYKLLTFQELEDFALLYYHEQQEKRNYIILTFCLFQALSVSEWKNITLENIDLQKGTVFIAPSLRTNARTLQLLPMQIGALYAFLNGRNEPQEKLFTTTPDVQKWILKLKKLYPPFTDFKQIKASVITYWIQTQGLRKAQYNAGHRYISSTESYLGNDLKSLQENLEQFHPLK